MAQYCDIIFFLVLNNSTSVQFTVLVMGIITFHFLNEHLGLFLANNVLIIRFEENMRGEREKRTDKAWNFCDYFSIQEELAEVMKRLGVRDEALVQYDELDALLTQFVLNSAAGGEQGNN